MFAADHPQQLGVPPADPSGSQPTPVIPPPVHSNIYVYDFAPDVSEDEFRSFFSPFGEILSIRMSTCNGAKPHAFVKFRTVHEAATALHTIQENPGGFLLSVKSALCDVPQRGLKEPEENDNVYLKNLPHGFQQKDVELLCGKYGKVKECAVMHSQSNMHNIKGHYSNGSDCHPPVSALCRMSSIEEAREVIKNLNDTELGPPHHGLRLVVRFHQPRGSSDKPAWGSNPRKNRPPVSMPQPNRESGTNPDFSLPNAASVTNSVGMEQLANELSRVGFSGGGIAGPVAGPVQSSLAVTSHALDPIYLSSFGGSNGMLSHVPSAHVPPPCRSLYISNLPEEADDLALYRMFAVYGAIESVYAVMKEKEGTLCKGFGFVNFGSAETAHFVQQLYDQQPRAFRIGHKTVFIQLQDRYRARPVAGG